MPKSNKQRECKHEYRMAKEGDFGENYKIPFIFYCIKCLIFTGKYYE